MQLRIYATFALVLFSMVSRSYANYALFDEPTDTISINGNTLLGTAATYEAIVQLRGDGGKIFSEWRTDQEDKSIVLTDNNFYAISLGVNSNVIAATPVLTQYQWHHFAYVYNGGEERLYMDGQLLTQRPGSGHIQNVALSTATIGAWVKKNVGDSFIGLIDTVRVSSVARYSGSSFDPPQGDFVPDADTELLFNFTESAGSYTVTDLSHNASIGYLGVGFTGATAPELLSALPIVGDMDYDGFVGINDLNTVLSHWNENAGIGNPQLGDITGDGFVGIDDLNLVLGNWNTGTPPPSSVPEPAGTAIVLLSSLMLRCRINTK